MTALTVSQLAAAIKNVVEGSFGVVQVQGEITKPMLAASGHFYADLRDDTALIPCVAWRGSLPPNQVPRNGDLVVITGELTTYPARGSYQLKILRIEQAGQGALLAQIEATKQKLAAEGLLAADRKKQLPYLPRKIGIVTSPKGAVIQDILHRLQARTPVPVMLWPTLVQGPGAAEEIAIAISGFNNLPENDRPDVLIIARGGGSFEDLLAFNTEVVARAVATSRIPTISGVGHEPDISLCDLAADVRAPTPTAAAEIAVPVRDDILAGLESVARQLTQRLTQAVTTQRSKLAYLARLIPQPQRQLAQTAQRLDEAATRLTHLTPRLLTPSQDKLSALSRLLTQLNPTAPLEKGFALVTDAQNSQPITTSQTQAKNINLTFKDGKRAAVLN